MQSTGLDQSQRHHINNTNAQSKELIHIKFDELDKLLQHNFERSRWGFDKHDAEFIAQEVLGAMTQYGTGKIVGKLIGKGKMKFGKSIFEKGMKKIPDIKELTQKEFKQLKDTQKRFRDQIDLHNNEIKRIQKSDILTPKQKLDQINLFNENDFNTLDNYINMYNLNEYRLNPTSKPQFIHEMKDGVLNKKSFYKDVEGINNFDEAKQMRSQLDLFIPKEGQKHDIFGFEIGDAHYDRFMKLQKESEKQLRRNGNNDKLQQLKNQLQEINPKGDEDLKNRIERQIDKIDEKMNFGDNEVLGRTQNLEEIVQEKPKRIKRDYQVVKKDDALLKAMNEDDVRKQIKPAIEQPIMKRDRLLGEDYVKEVPRRKKFKNQLGEDILLTENKIPKEDLIKIRKGIPHKKEIETQKIQTQDIEDIAQGKQNTQQLEPKPTLMQDMKHLSSKTQGLYYARDAMENPLQKTLGQQNVVQKQRLATDNLTAAGNARLEKIENLYKNDQISNQDYKEQLNKLMKREYEKDLQNMSQQDILQWMNKKQDLGRMTRKDILEWIKQQK